MWYNKFISEVVLKNDTIPHSVGAFQRHEKKKKNPYDVGITPLVT